MNRYERIGNDKNYNRASDVSVSPDTVKTIEKIAVAHLAAGSYDGFKLAIGSLSKFNEKAEIEGLKAQLDIILQKMGK